MLQGLKTLGRLLRKAGPYLVLEILLPGGTALALLLLLYRTGRLSAGTVAQRMQAGAHRAAWVSATILPHRATALAPDRPRLAGQRLYGPAAASMRQGMG